MRVDIVITVMGGLLADIATPDPDLTGSILVVDHDVDGYPADELVELQGSQVHVTGHSINQLTADYHAALTAAGWMEE